MKRLFLLALLWIFAFYGIASARDDFQYWSQFSIKAMDTEKIDFTLFAENRFYNDADDPGLYFVSPRLKYDAWDHVSLGLNYTYLQVKTNNSVAKRSEFKFQHRLETEVNPYWKVGDWLKVDNRNRMEFRWIEDKGSFNTRLRHRWTLTRLLKGKKLTGVFANSEFFYNIAEHEYNENRTIPLGLQFKLNDKSSLKIFYLIQSKGSSGQWSSTHSLGTLYSLRF